MAMKTDEMVGALASISEEKRQAMMAERLEMFSGMSEEKRRHQ